MNKAQGESASVSISYKMTGSDRHIRAMNQEQEFIA